MGATRRSSIGMISAGSIGKNLIRKGSLNAESEFNKTKKIFWFNHFIISLCIVWILPHVLTYIMIFSSSHSLSLSRTSHTNLHVSLSNLLAHKLHFKNFEVFSSSISESILFPSSNKSQFFSRHLHENRSLILHYSIYSLLHWDEINTHDWVLG